VANKPAPEFLVLPQKQGNSHGNGLKSLLFEILFWHRCLHFNDDHAVPAWAKERAQIDTIGNLTVVFGSDPVEATVFIAHMDEVCYEITEIAVDGTLSLRSLGGVEALSSSSPDYLQGVFLQRARPEAKSLLARADASALLHSHSQRLHGAVHDHQRLFEFKLANP